MTSAAVSRCRRNRRPLGDDMKRVGKLAPTTSTSKSHEMALASELAVNIVSPGEASRSPQVGGGRTSSPPARSPWGSRAIVPQSFFEGGRGQRVRRSSLAICLGALPGAGEPKKSCCLRESLYEVSSSRRSGDGVRALRHRRRNRGRWEAAAWRTRHSDNGDHAVRRADVSRCS